MSDGRPPFLRDILASPGEEESIAQIKSGFDALSYELRDVAQAIHAYTVSQLKDKETRLRTALSSDAPAEDQIQEIRGASEQSMLSAFEVGEIFKISAALIGTSDALSTMDWTIGSPDRANPEGMALDFGIERATSGVRRLLDPDEIAQAERLDGIITAIPELRERYGNLEGFRQSVTAKIEDITAQASTLMHSAAAIKS